MTDERPLPPPPPLSPGWRLAIAALVAPPLGVFLAALGVFALTGADRLGRGGIVEFVGGGVGASLLFALFGCVIAYPVVLVFGVPLHLLAREHRLRHGLWYALAGAGVGQLVMSVFSEPGEALLFGAWPGCMVALVGWWIAVHADPGPAPPGSGEAP